jgi:hypothetical protein
MTRLLARLLVGLPVAVVVATAQLLVLVVRLGLWLLGRVGFRGARLAGLAATLAGVWWATRHVGIGPASRLAVIGWAAWAIRHHRAALGRHAAVRRLTATLERHASALAAATTALGARPTPSPDPATTPARSDARVPAAPSRLAFEPSPGLATVTRAAAARARRRLRPADDTAGATPPPRVARSHRRQPR